MEIRERSCDGKAEETTFRFTCALDHDRAYWLAVTILTPDGPTTTTPDDPDFESQWGGSGHAT